MTSKQKIRNKYSMTEEIEFCSGISEAREHVPYHAHSVNSGKISVDVLEENGGCLSIRSCLDSVLLIIYGSLAAAGLFGY